MRRISVVGNSGSGKTRLARRLAERLGVPHLELDAVFHQPGWSALPEPEFRNRVAVFVDQPAWVVDGNYKAVRDLVWARADTVIWLDYSRRVVMWQIIRRTVGRLLLRRELWNGNRERWTNLITRDPDRSVLAWAWTMHDNYRARYLEAAQDAAHGHITFIRVRSRRELDALFA